MKIFVSSTYEDLKNERQSAITTIERIGQAVAMEKFFASDHQSKDVCLRRLQECDAMILIFGSRYGSVDQTEGISITEIEYNTAKVLGLPMFVFMKTASDRTWRSEETDAGRLAKHLAFKSRLDKEQLWKTFATPDQLETEILGALYQYELEHGALGVRLSAFATFEDFFRPFQNRSRLFNHTYPLAGRLEFLERLHGFAESNKRVAILCGRGGIGKSKIIFEFGKQFALRHSSYKLRFLREGVLLTDEAIRQLPAQQCVLVADDAHRREDLKTLLAIARQHPDRTKVVLAFRTQGLDYVRAVLNQAGFDPREIEDLGEVKELRRTELEALGKHVLGRRHQHLLGSLVQAAKDSPLVLVVGGQLLAKDAISPALLERHSEFQHAVFDRFQDILVGEVSNKLTPELCRNLLSLISALSPIRPQNDNFQNRASRFLGLDNVQLVNAIGILEQAGILLRRGYSLRITPDVLSDHILYNACLTPQEQPTGYAKKVFDAFRTISPENVLTNLSELDWRINQEGMFIDLLNEIWLILEHQFQRASHRERRQIIEWLEQVAYFQPGRTLSLVECAMRNPSTKRENNTWASIYQYTHSDVLHALPKLLRLVAYNPGYLPRCCDLLWELGRDDERATNSHPEHAIRVLADLARYDIGKPVRVNATVLQRVERCLKDANAHSHAHSPLDVLEPLLAKEGHFTWIEGHKVVWRPYAVDFRTTRPIRQKAIALLSECTKSDLATVVLRALKSLVEALQLPHGLFGRNVSDEEINQWLPEQEQVLEVIENLARTARNPIIQIQIASDLKWHARHGSQQTIRDKALGIIESIPDTFEVRLVRALWRQYDRDWKSEDYNRHEERLKAEVQRAATEFLGRFPNVKEGFDYLNSLLDQLQSYEIQPTPGYFLYLLAETSSQVAAEICELIIAEPTCPLATDLSALLSGVRRKDPIQAVTLIKSAIRDGSKALCLSIAHGFADWRWASDIKIQEVEVIEQLLKHPDDNVRSKAIESLGHFSEPLKRKGIQLAVQVEIGENQEATRALCGIFDPHYGIPPELLTEEDLSAILSRLIGINKLDYYEVDRFLAYCASSHPRLVFKLLLDRLKLVESEESARRDYEPVPYDGFDHALKGISSAPEYTDILKTVRDRALTAKGMTRSWLPKLFRDISDDFCEKALGVLGEWVTSKNSKKIEAVGLLLHDVYPEFVLSESEFVSQLLGAAYAAGDECYRSVENNLRYSAIYGTRSGTLGQPMPRDVALRDQASHISRGLPAGSPTQRFYESLVIHAESSIRNALVRDEELTDD